MTNAPTPQRLYLFQIGTTSIPLPNGTLEMSSGCYLVQMSDGQNILIDTGVPAGFAVPGAPATQNPKSVLEHLADLGLKPDDITMLISTHFDIDHIGYNDSFPKAELVVQRAHYELARGGHPRFAAGREHWDHPALHYRLVDGNTELFPGLTLLETPGHAPFHQSVLLRLPHTGAVLLAIDAVVMERLFTADRTAWPMDDNQEQLRASTQKLLDVVARENVQLTVFGHDGLQWRTLKKSPEFYD
ncbi:MAG: N-acyl homoserine lactonase family protein [Chloroflexota bacterium]